jgi:hypothetical protein
MLRILALKDSKIKSIVPSGSTMQDSTKITTRLLQKEHPFFDNQQVMTINRMKPRYSNYPFKECETMFGHQITCRYRQ